MDLVKRNGGLIRAHEIGLLVNMVILPWRLYK